MSGKGSGRRPTQINEEEAEANWNRIFGKKPLYVPLAEHFNLLLDDPDGFNTMDNLIENPKEEEQCHVEEKEKELEAR